MNKDIKNVLISEAQLEETVARLAKEIDEAYANVEGRLVLLGILKGSVVFMGDLMKRLHTPVEIEFMKVSSYGKGTVSSGNIKIQLDVSIENIKDCNILIVEDIIDSGRTLSYLTEYLRLKGARDVKTMTALDKPSRREVDFVPDFVGLQIPDEFVVGYGLDFDEKYRALPYVAVLHPRAYGKES
ncbi:MAG: hypoxanthine phosphoribosyltransferase [Clostridia bacterium]|nr:hypoxanthine phosphoribosyltransferase [Clostridia bacterium]